MRKPLDIVAALRQKNLLGVDLETRGAWLAFLKALYGLPLDEAELATFRRHTGRDDPRPGGYAEAAAIVGRQSGKTEMAAWLALYEAARAVRAGESGVIIPLVAQDSRSAQRALLGYVRRAIEKSPTLKKAVTRETSDTIELAGVAISVYPCRPAAVRGIRAPVAVVDELAHFVATDGRPTDREMLAAIRPTLATTGGKLITLSSPYAASGALFDLHRKHHGEEDSPILVWVADAPAMNPTGYQAAAWRKAGIDKRDSKRDTSGNYLEMLLAVNSGAVRLLDHDRALRELRTLERKTGTGGRDRVDHRRGAHDDLAAAIAGAIGEARTTATLKLKWNHDGGMIWPEPIEGIDNRGCEWREGRPWNGDFRRSAKLIERYLNGRQIGSDGRTLWVLARRPGANPATAPTQIHRTQYEREGDWILAEGER